MRARLVPLIAAALLVASCSGGEVIDPTTTTGTAPDGDDGTSTTLIPPSTTTTQPAPEFPDIPTALAYLAKFDPVAGNPAGVREAMAMVNGHVTGLDTARWIEQGTPEVRDAVAVGLSIPSATNVQLLVAMDTFGAPSGSPGSPARWDPVDRVAITTALERASTGFYGRLAEAAITVIRRHVEAELEACSASGCPWGGVFYDLPVVITGIDGTVVDTTDGERLDGSATIRSADGSVRTEPIGLERIVGQWVIVSGYLAEERPPVLAVIEPPDGIVSTEPVVEVSGVADPDTTVTMGGDEFSVGDGQFWTLAAELDPGRNELAVTAVDEAGLETVVVISVVYAPDAVEQLGYIVDLDGATIVLDPAVLLFGEEANEAARLEGVIGEDETLPVPFYLANPEVEAEPYPLSEDAGVVLFDVIGEPILVPVADLVALRAGGGDMAAWSGDPVAAVYRLLVAGGLVLQIEQQLFP